MKKETLKLFQAIMMGVSCFTGLVVAYITLCAVFGAAPILSNMIGILFYIGLVTCIGYTLWNSFFQLKFLEEN